MKIILDECIPKKFKSLILHYDVKTVPEMGWAGVTNGKLLALIEKDFEVFVTVDRNLAFQQNTKNLRIGIIVLHSKSNRFEDLRSLVPKLLSIFPNVTSGQIYNIGEQQNHPSTKIPT